MTTSQPDALSAISSEMISGTDSEGCVCVVASYVAVASLLSAATEDASRRIMMTPALGDFVELRFVSMGPEPGETGDHTDAVKLITQAVLTSGGDTGHSYFAVAVVDRSAAEVERLLAEIAKFPFLTGLPMRLHGIAVLEDRRSGRDVTGDQITVAGPDAWNHGYLVDELRCYAEELMRHFAAGQEGLPWEELDALRAQYEGYAVRDNGEERPAVSADAVPAAPARPDILSDPHSAASQSAVSQPAIPVPVLPPASSNAPDVASLPRPEDGEPAPPGPRLRRWLHAGWHRKDPPDSAPAAEAITPRVSALVYLLIIGEPNASDPTAWKRSRAALLAADQRIAALEQVAYSIRPLHGDEAALRGESRPAGELSRRDIKGPVSDADFSGVLKEIRKLLRRDTARSAGSGKPMAWPAVVFFAPEPPVADSVAAEEFGHLGREATVIWVVPKETKDLMAPAFIEPGSVHVVEDGDGAADDIAGLMTPGSFS